MYVRMYVYNHLRTEHSVFCAYYRLYLYMSSSRSTEHAFTEELVVLDPKDGTGVPVPDDRLALAEPCQNYGPFLGSE